MNLETIKKNLNKNIEIIDNTFELFNLSVIGCNVIKVDNDGWFTLGLEISKINSQESIQNGHIKAICYDSDSNIIDTDKNYINSEDFMGYDVIKFDFQQDNTAYNTAKIRLFVTKG